MNKEFSHKFFRKKSKQFIMTDLGLKHLNKKRAAPQLEQLIQLKNDENE